jgi:subtilisin-like proprotein convertase family protein
MKQLRTSLFLCALLLGFGLKAQTQKTISYTPTEVSPAMLPTIGVPQINATSYKLYHIDPQYIKAQLLGIANREDESKGFKALISFPHPDGTIHQYEALENSTLSPELAEKFPKIRTYDAHDDEGRFVKWDITQKGLHVMIMQPDESTIFIDPVVDGNNEYYIVYYKKDFTTSKVKSCDFDSDVANLKPKTKPVSGTVKTFGTCDLRTYRLAVAATGEYTIFHGGGVANAQAAQATTMNRVNGVYERDMAITMTIIGNNDLIIYTNTGSDPYTNGNTGAMINENQANVDAVIGSGNYDIGHVFGTNSGGLAGLGVVCANNQKARGVTGSAAPINDPFDIDYVAHEMGHQFGANHTQYNQCNRNNATAMEPGSASTIMGYAGICAPNVQSNSDDHFHGVSLEEIGIEILSAGHQCEQMTTISNNPPAITATNGNVTVPANTPFALTASVVDPDGDPLLYCWEQMDNTGNATQPPAATNTEGPNFRSNSPDPDSTRYFPNLADLAAGISPTWEVIPSVSRTMNFRVTVRDQGLGVPGCNDHADVTVTTDVNSGPFVVLYPSATGIVWAGLTTETVTWDVANTDVAPVNCSTVDIFLSTDGGATYPFTLATGVPNDGSEAISVPNVATTTARVMVMNSNGTFFDISDNDFEITMATFDFTQSVTVTDVSICQPNDATYTVDIGEVGGYSDPVTLSVSGVPAGATSNFSVNPVTPVGQSVLTITNTGAAAPGVYPMVISGASTTGTKTTNITLTISDASPAAVTQISPANLATGVAVPTQFDWNAATGTGITYEIDIATDAGFTAMVDQATGLASPTYTSAILASSTTYYWRVRSATGCGQSAWSATWEFTTNSCSNYVSTDVGQTTDVASFTSIINVTATGTINDVNVASLDISHPWVGDLSATLTSPTGTVVQLFDGPGIPASTWGCDGDDIDVSFDDAAANTATDFENACGGGAPTISGPYQSMDPLANFNGESITGTWTLTVSDSYLAGDDGTLNGWSLDLCTDPINCTDPDVPTVTGNTTICEGATTTLSVSAGNLNDASDWSWYEGSCGGTAVGTGATMAVSPTVTTSYFVRGEGGCVTPGTCFQIDVTVNPTYNLNETASICQGQTYTYPDGSTGTVTETHTSMLTTTAGCDSIIVTALTVVTAYNMTESASICDGDTYTFPDGSTGTTAQTQTSLLMSTGGCDSIIVTTLTVNMPYTGNESATICDGDTYTFPDGSTGTTAQTQTSVLTDVNGCDSTIITNLSVTTVDATVTDNSPTLTANATGATYQWVDCDNGNSPIAGATNQSYTPTATVGNYAVIVTQNGCQEMSTCYLVDQNALSELDLYNVNIYPNPTSGQLKIEWDGVVNTIELTDSRGRLLRAIDSHVMNNIDIDLDEYSNGVYFIHLLTNDGRIVQDLIKQ